MRVFKVPFDTKKEEKIFRWLFKFKTGNVFNATIRKFCNICYTNGYAIKNITCYNDIYVSIIVHISKNQ